MNAYLIDLIGVTGLGLLCYGCYLVYPPAAYVVGGGCLLAYAIKAEPATGEGE